MKISCFWLLVILYLLSLCVVIPFRMQDRYLTPDEQAYTETVFIDHAKTHGILLNSVDGAIGVRYLVAAYYFNYTNLLGGRCLIFVINIIVLISVLFVFWRDCRHELCVDPVKYFALLFMLPSVVFFSLAALRDIYIYAIAIFMLNRVGRAGSGLDLLATGAMVIFLLISPFYAFLSGIAWFLSKMRLNVVRFAIIAYYILFLILIIGPYLDIGEYISYLNNQNIPAAHLSYLQLGVLGGASSAETYSNAAVILANISLSLMPYILLRNVVGMLDWVFFIQSMFMLILIPFFIRRLFRVRLFFLNDARFRFSICCMLLFYPLLFKEKDASTIIRHSMVMFPYFLYIVLATRKRILRKIIDWKRLI